MAALFDSAGVPCDVVDDIWKAKWQKLMWNATFNSLNAITRVSVERLATEPQTARLCRRALREVAAVGRACGVDLSDVDDEVIESILEVTKLMGSAPTSMLQDLMAGRPLENAIMSGAVARRAREKGVDAPVQEALAAMLEAMSPRA